MKTVTFSNDQLLEVKRALIARIRFCKSCIYEFENRGGDRMIPHLMYWRDHLDIAEQALALVEA